MRSTPLRRRKGSQVLAFFSVQKTEFPTVGVRKSVNFLRTLWTFHGSGKCEVTECDREAFTP
jgi:hypothetical protein